MSSKKTWPQEFEKEMFAGNRILATQTSTKLFVHIFQKLGVVVAKKRVTTLSLNKKRQYSQEYYMTALKIDSVERNAGVKNCYSKDFYTFYISEIVGNFE